MGKELKNPFVLSGYYGPKYFCDRIQETNTIVKAIKNKSNLTLIGHRRLGKTGLIKHVFNTIGKDFVCIYSDLLPTQDLNTFTGQMIKSITRQLPESTGMGKRVWKWIKSLRPSITFDALSGEPQISLRDTNADNQKRTIDELFQILESLDKPVLIALDEFQQIHAYPEDWLEAWIRSEIQSLKNVNFIFSGSQMSILSDMFNKPANPFYHSTQFLSLEKIRLPEYAAFISSHFQSGRILIKDADIDYVLNWTRGYTFYVQSVFNRIYRFGAKTINRDQINSQLELLLDEMAVIFYQYRELLTVFQWNLLKYIALEEVVRQPTGKDFLSKYNLGNSASVKRALEALEEKEMLLVQIDENGQKNYSVYDTFLLRWLQRIYIY